MRIVSVELRVLRIPLRVPMDTAGGRMSVLERGLLRLRAAGGSATGAGSDTFEGLGEIAREVPPGVGRRIADALEGVDATDPRAVAVLLDRLDQAPWAGRAVRSAVSSAISDLAAQAQGRSLATELGGGGRASVALNGLIGRSPAAQAAERAAILAAEGYGCLKVKGGGEPADAVVERVAAVRAAVGPDVALRLDLNGSLDVVEASPTLARFQAFDLEYVEQPVAESTTVGDLARLRRDAAVPIAADESVSGLAAARALLDAHAVDALVVKPARVGGLAEAAAIVELAGHADIPVTVSTLLETGVGLAGALHVASLAAGDGVHGLATGSLLTSDLLAAPLPVEAGRMSVPHGPGLGIDLDAAALERWGETWA